MYTPAKTFHIWSSCSFVRLHVWSHCSLKKKNEKKFHHHYSSLLTWAEVNRCLKLLIIPFSLNKTAPNKNPTAWWRHCRVSLCEWRNTMCEWCFEVFLGWSTILFLHQRHCLELWTLKCSAGPSDQTNFHKSIWETWFICCYGCLFCKKCQSPPPTHTHTVQTNGEQEIVVTYRPESVVAAVSLVLPETFLQLHFVSSFHQF